MPLGSVTEWRARIGSSWCALGRPFKTRSPFRGNAGQSKTKLTLNEVVTLMMILIAFVGANLAFRAILIGGHYRELSGIAIYMHYLMLDAILDTVCIHFLFAGAHVDIHACNNKNNMILLNEFRQPIFY